SPMRQRYSIQCSADKRAGVCVIHAGRRLEGHSAPPTCRSLRVNSAEDYPPTPEGSFYDCGGTVGILTDNCTPAGKLRAIFPVLVERWRSGNSYRYRRLSDA